MGEKRTASEIFRNLLKRIIKLELYPGMLVSENQIASEYKVSRSVIRTAFARLQQLGFLEVYPQRGTYVSLIDLNFIADVLLLRTAVEKEIIYEIFTKLSEKEYWDVVNCLEENLKEQKKYHDEEDYQGQFGKLDGAFHTMMITSVQRKSLMDMLEDRMYHMYRWRNFDVAFDNRVPELIDQHMGLLNAFKERNLEKAQLCMEVHLETISSIADRAMAEYPDYFKQSAHEMDGE